MNAPKLAAKKLVAKAGRKSRSAAARAQRRQMTAALAEKRAVSPVDGPKFDGVAFLRSLR